MVPYHSLHLPFGYIFSYCVCQVCQVCTYCVLHGSKLDIFTYLGTSILFGQKDIGALASCDISYMRY